MDWRDLLYFSKGERQALVMLIALIAMAWTAVLCGDIYTSTKRPMALVPSGKADTIRGGVSIPLPDTTARQAAPVSVPQAAPHVSRRRLSVPEGGKIPSRRTSRSSYPRNDKFPTGTVVELNSADTLILKRVPGIGSVFSRRIVKFRDLLGGFYRVEQLAEVYGIDEERYMALRGWFAVDSAAVRRLPVNKLSARELARHPYVSYRQAYAIERLRRQEGAVTGWERLRRLPEFPPEEWHRLRPYLSFE